MNQKVILITGASSGIGLEAARQLIEKGHIVYAVARRIEMMLPLLQLGGYTHSMDVTNETSMKEGVAKVIDEQGRIDVLVNNAGYGSLGAVEEVSLDEARNQFEVNLFGVARLCQLVLPHMRALGKGRIVNISSIGARVYEPLCGWYHSTKFALEGLSDCMRLELKPFGIDVVLVQPGFIRTEWEKVAHENLKQFSGNGPYRETANKLANAHINFLFRYFASDAPVVAKTIVKTVGVNSPKTRYATGRASGLFLFLRKSLPDKWLDQVFLIMLNMYGRDKERRLVSY